MSRRLRKEKWTLAFTQVETNAIFMGLGILYKRSLHHLVAPNFAPFPYLPAVARSIADDDVWHTLEAAQKLMVVPSNPYYTPRYKSVIPAANNGTFLDVASSHLFLPNQSTWHPERVPGNLGDYAAAARECRAKWLAVRDLFNDLNKVTNRTTAAYYWPCASALMAVGGVTRHDLTDIDRPGAINAILTVPLRETSAFVMQHTLLPPVDNEVASDYEGDEDTGIAAKLVLSVDNDDQFSCDIWPITAGA